MITVNFYHFPWRSKASPVFYNYQHYGDTPRASLRPTAMRGVDSTWKLTEDSSGIWNSIKCRMSFYEKLRWNKWISYRDVANIDRNRVTRKLKALPKKKHSVRKWRISEQYIFSYFFSHTYVFHSFTYPFWADSELMMCEVSVWLLSLWQLLLEAPDVTACLLIIKTNMWGFICLRAEHCPMNI